MVENINLNETIRRQLEEISDLETSSNIKTETSKKLNKRLSELKEKTEKEKAATIKSFKAEIKSWRKELGEERKEKIKLEEKLKKFVSEHQNKDINKKCSKKVTSEPVIPVQIPSLTMFLNNSVGKNTTQLVKTVNLVIAPGIQTILSQLFQLQLSLFHLLHIGCFLPASCHFRTHTE